MYSWLAAAVVAVVGHSRMTEHIPCRKAYREALEVPEVMRALRFLLLRDRASLFMSAPEALGGVFPTTAAPEAAAEVHIFLGM
jgi:hypothetical protein